MNLVYLSIGSNFQAVVNIPHVLECLSTRFNVKRVSSVYQNSALHNVSDDDADYYNLVLLLETLATYEELKMQLKLLEVQYGRTKEGSDLGNIPMDLDIIIFDGQSLNSCSCAQKEVPVDKCLVKGEGDYKEERQYIVEEAVTKHSFILGPLAQIADDLVDCYSGKRYRDLWAEYDKTKHPLHKVVLG